MDLSQTQQEIPSLLSIVQNAIKDRYRSFLGDIGSIEVGLIEDALAAASPEELIHIEDSTLRGVFKRDLVAYTWPLWYNLCVKHDSHGFFSSLKTMPPLPPAVDKSSSRGQPLGLASAGDIAPANYRAVYYQIMKHREEKLALTGQRLKKMRTQEEEKKASRSIQVIESRLDKRGHPIPLLHKTGAGTTGAAVPSRAVNFGKPTQQPPKQQQNSVKNRIMKKLNVSAPDLKLHNKQKSPLLQGRGGGGNKKPMAAARQLPTQAVLAGRVKVKSRAELAKEEAERKMNQLKAASVLNDDDIFSRKRR